MRALRHPTLLTWRQMAKHPHCLVLASTKQHRQVSWGPPRYDGTIPICPKLGGTCGKVERDRDISVLWIPHLPLKTMDRNGPKCRTVIRALAPALLGSQSTPQVPGQWSNPSGSPLWATPCAAEPQAPLKVSGGSWVAWTTDRHLFGSEPGRTTGAFRRCGQHLLSSSATACSCWGSGPARGQLRAGSGPWGCLLQSFRAFSYSLFKWELLLDHIFAVFRCLNTFFY